MGRFSIHERQVCRRVAWPFARDAMKSPIAISFLFGLKIKKWLVSEM
jgi:hypothetical protein